MKTYCEQSNVEKRKMGFVVLVKLYNFVHQMKMVREDSFRHKGLRRRLVAELKDLGISNPDVLAAIGTVERHFFLDNAFDDYAYDDRAFPIAADQTISRPYTVAFQTSLLELKPMDKVLEIGTGSAYQASILAHLGVQVYTIERQRELYDNNLKYFPFANKYRNIKFFYGDGFEGLPSFAPFDKIIVTAAAPFVPEKLLCQLKIGGVLVIPVDDKDQKMQHMQRILKLNETEFQSETFGEFSFVPMLTGRSS
jgi:protein-L-isoaspartate(D-aspartate) O-methyltransferase